MNVNFLNFLWYLRILKYCVYIISILPPPSNSSRVTTSQIPYKEWDLFSMPIVKKKLINMTFSHVVQSQVCLEGQQFQWLRPCGQCTPKASLANF